MTMRVASAPVSWGITEVQGLHSDLQYGRVMDEIRQAGYEGTELGPWGFYPATPHDLRAALGARSLTLVAAFVDVPVHDPALFYLGREAVRRTAPLLTELGAASLILSAQGTPGRLRIAGRVTEADGLSAEQWSEAAAYLQELARMASDMGMAAVFHHHAGTYVETPQEIERLFNEVDTGLLGLCLDTGHLAYGAGDNMAVMATIARFGTIIRHVHLKNIDPAVLKGAQSSKLGYVEAVRGGLFCALDTGSVDIPAVIDALKKLGYDGWLVVEQDVGLAAQAGKPGHGNVDPVVGAIHAREYLHKVMGA